MPLDLHDDQSLRAACADIERQVAAPDHWARSWRSELALFLTRVAKASEQERATLDFQKWLWDDNPVTSVGMGNIRVGEALAKPELRAWLAKVSLEPLPEDIAARAARLERIHHELLERVEQHTSRSPRLKTLRVMAALFPDDFTTIADGGRLRVLHDVLCPPRRVTAVERNVRIMQRLAEVLGPPSQDPESRAARMTLPWMLYLLITSADDETTVEAAASTGGELRLRPLPALRRRKGLTAIGGTFQRMLTILQEIKDGMTREDLIDYLRGDHPGSKTSSYGMLINVFMSEFGVLRREDGLYKLTPVGEAVLETGDPDPLAEWLLTRILGVDHVLAHLKAQEAASDKELIEVLQGVNPGWTNAFTPKSVLGWLRAMGVLEKHDGSNTLTERGHSWAEQIHWTPERLPSETEDAAEQGQPDILEVLAEASSSGLQIPALDVIDRHIRAKGVFTSEMVRDLHAGLAAHPRRHLAVLAGLSGTGKTLLAKEYGTALVGGEEQARHRLEIIPVQPGWYDPGALLGYVNPIKAGEYVRTAFLEFLLRVVGDPTRPYVVILDEMNLSHPEQYMAPLLSAMETGGRLALHAEGDDLDGVPDKLPYPGNLFILGTVNMDETTQGLSDKVLDRAFVLEFWDVSLDAYPKWGKTGLPADDEDRVRRVLEGLLKALRPARLHFGWRVVDDVFGFLHHAHVGGSDGLGGALDSVLYAKIMPKLRGDDAPRFRAALEAIRVLTKDERLTRCQVKVNDLLHDLETTGSARFWR